MRAAGNCLKPPVTTVTQSPHGRRFPRHTREKPSRVLQNWLWLNPTAAGRVRCALKTCAVGSPRSSRRWCGYTTTLVLVGGSPRLNSPSISHRGGSEDGGHAYRWRSGGSTCCWGMSGGGICPTSDVQRMWTGDFASTTVNLPVVRSSPVAPNRGHWRPCTVRTAGEVRLSPWSTGSRSSEA